jgi:signal transduction histidine kinase
LAQRDELLRASGIESIRLRDARGTTLVLAGDPNAQPAKTFDLREETQMQALQRGVVAILAEKDMLVRIIADSPFRPQTEIEFVMHRMPLTSAVRELEAPDAWMTLAVASAVGLFLYVALLILLVRPMRRLTSSITAFRADPEHGVPLDPGAVSVLHDDEISLAGRELAVMQRELRAALWRNSRLAAVGTVVAKVSHDVRGVLTPMLLHADRLSRHADPMVRRAGESLVQGVERAIDLVHRTLDFAREGPPPPMLSAIRLRALVAEAGDSVRGLLAVFQIENLVPPEKEVEADRNHLFRVLVNLMRNAAEAGATRVRARVRENGEVLAIELADDGPGLPEIVRANLFRPFTGTRRTGGSGLGLAIARDLMLAHGGDIGLVSTGPGGTTFRLTLPQAVRADREPQAADLA